MRRIAIPALAGLALVGAAACSPDEGDFKDDAEDFINDDDGVEQQMGTDMSEATCQEPGSKEVGATFSCTGVGADGTTYDFSVEITGDNSYQVSGGTPAADPATPGTADPTAPASSAPIGTTPATAPPATG